MFRLRDIQDIKDMPDFNPLAGSKGIDSVSKGLVYLKYIENLHYHVIPYCKGTGHSVDSALLRVGKYLWRCPEDNEGCYWNRT